MSGHEFPLLNTIENLGKLIYCGSGSGPHQTPIEPRGGNREMPLVSWHPLASRSDKKLPWAAQGPSLRVTLIQYQGDQTPTSVIRMWQCSAREVSKVPSFWHLLTVRFTASNFLAFLG
jgi:hypothetical protein